MLGWNVTSRPAPSRTAAVAAPIAAQRVVRDPVWVRSAAAMMARAPFALVTTTQS